MILHNIKRLMPQEGGIEHEGHKEKQPKVLELELEGRRVKITLSPEVENWLREKKVTGDNDISKFFRSLLTNSETNSENELIKEFLNRFRVLIRDEEVLFLEKKEKIIEEVNAEGRRIGITRREFLRIVAAAIATLGLGLGWLAARTRRYLFQFSTPTPTSTPTPVHPTQTPTSTKTHTPEPTPTQTPQPTKTPTPEPTRPIIEEEKVKEIKNRFFEVLSELYPSIYKALFIEPPPFVIEAPLYPPLVTSPFIMWHDTFGYSMYVRNTSFYLMPSKKDKGEPSKEDKVIVRIRMPKKNYEKLFWDSKQRGVLIGLEEKDGPAVIFYFVLNEKLLRKIAQAPQIMVIVRSSKEGKYKKYEINEEDNNVVIEIEVAPEINLIPELVQKIGISYLGEYRVFIDVSTVTPPDFIENPPQNIPLTEENAEKIVFQRLALDLLLAKILYFSFNDIEERYSLGKWLSEDFIKERQNRAEIKEKYHSPYFYRIFLDPNYRRAFEEIIKELVEKWEQEVQG